MEEIVKEIWSFLQSYAVLIKWTTPIDIGIISIFLYKIMKLIRDSSGALVLKGLLVVVVVTQISGWVGFTVVNFVLVNATQLGIIALMVLFQPEIRRMLVSVGKSKIPSLSILGDSEFSEGDIDRIAAQVVEATTALSWDRMGALIVFERKVPLGDIIKTGTIVDAHISSDILRNIFYPKAPLHDGAAIIRGGKIAAASCVLPLSENTYIARELGTRHRAAIGVSESSDAVAVVVSEETGSVSIASRGMLKRNLSPEMLSKLLLVELKTEREIKNKNFFQRSAQGLFSKRGKTK